MLALYLVLSTALVVLGQRSVQRPPFAVGGIPVQRNGPIPPRRNINDLQREAGPEWDLYVQALAAMQRVNEADDLSYFQIAGIHGLPAIEWNNTGPRVGRGFGGYCPHGEDLFLPWHRPYTALFEMILNNHARRIASSYPTSLRNRYIQAAQALRAPFWDWADNSDVPPSTTVSRLSINTAQGRQSIDNPLFTYRFPADALQGRFTAFSPGNAQTVRCPPRNYPASANANLRRENLRERMYQAFIYATTFSEFSSSRGNSQNLEQCHNSVHGSATCGNQFSDPRYAGFDPLFMLHHANVDRLWTLWQFARPEAANFIGSYSGGSRFSTAQGTTITPNSPMAPFFHPNGRPCTPNSVSDHRIFGYTYDGLDSGRRRSDTEYIGRSARRTINELYSGRQYSPLHREPHKAHLAHLSYRAEELRGPAKIDLYFCDKYVGDVYVMPEPQTGPITATLPVDDAIKACGKTTEDLRRIANHMSAQITTTYGREIPISSIPSLKLEMEDLQEIPNPSMDEFPEIRDRHHAPGQLRQYGAEQRQQDDGSDGEAEYAPQEQSQEARESGDQQYGGQY
ncbi:hypothetical protein L249_0161 [Ophiocordyceps polyrhachis-furcata BCC 54312]|uniref:Tyrosinase copper-binding domain-containing protein n=1 Tax=Ophiocordyceps polyrhachis-furcata BCC 54312 TaxID=1330021 RepID=A0A367LE15_9HYPO|nr:hypothetical protein L249_0161 [Ophiocordyceps polyrhachis-furcata BCC 54312]